MSENNNYTKDSFRSPTSYGWLYQTGRYNVFNWSCHIKNGWPSYSKFLQMLTKLIKAMKRFIHVKPLRSNICFKHFISMNPQYYNNSLHIAMSSIYDMYVTFDHIYYSVFHVTSWRDCEDLNSSKHVLKGRNLVSTVRRCKYLLYTSLAEKFATRTSAQGPLVCFESTLHPGWWVAASWTDSFFCFQGPPGPSWITYFYHLWLFTAGSTSVGESYKYPFIHEDPMEPLTPY